MPTRKCRTAKMPKCRDKQPAYALLIDETAQYQQDLDDYAKTQFLSIITGEIDVDEGFEELLREWEKRGGKAWTEAMNAEYQRRQSIK